MADASNHLSCNNFEAWVNVKDAPLKQYEVVNVAENGESNCWIPSQTDQAFSICYHKKLPDDYDYLAQIYLDGVLVRDTIHVGPETEPIWTIAHARVANNERRCFMFGPVTTTDDDSCLGHGQSVGEIRIDITKARARRVIEEASARGPVVAIPEVKVDERLKQSVAHQVKYGTVAEKRGPSISKCYDKVKYERMARFVFRYRPLDFLQAKGFALRPAPQREYIEIPDSPPRSSVSRDDTAPRRFQQSVEHKRVKLESKLSMSSDSVNAKSRSMSRVAAPLVAEQKPIIKKQEKQESPALTDVLQPVQSKGAARWSVHPAPEDNFDPAGRISEREQALLAELAHIRREREILVELEKIRNSDPAGHINERERVLLVELAHIRREREILVELENIRVSKRTALEQDIRPRKKVKGEQR